MYYVRTLENKVGKTIIPNDAMYMYVEVLTCVYMCALVLLEYWWASMILYTELL